jgi:phosphatidylserine/phosphatidylglycerophosphate/cardiolipin synthase-like enzyme
MSVLVISSTLPSLFAVALMLAVSGCSASDSVELEDAELGACNESALFATIASRVRKVEGSGLVPASLLVTHRNAASSEPIVYGTAIFDAAADMIERAERDVELQTWRWDIDSDPSLRVLSGLKRLEARRRERHAVTPVVVRLLLNRVTPQGSYTVTDVARQIAAEHLDPAFVDVQIVDFFATGLGANHAKTLVVDRTFALVTGANITNDYGKSPDMWDAAFRIRGEVAQSIHADFAAMWSRGRLWSCGTEREQAPSDINPVFGACWDKPVALPMIASTPAKECLPMLTATRVTNGALLPSATEENPQAQMFLGAVSAAEREIRLQSPNLNEDAMKKAIVLAVRRGIRVQLILSKKFEETGESLPGRGGGNEKTVADLYAALADVSVDKACSLLQVRWYSQDGSVAVEGTRPPASHVKYLSVDGQIVVIGSANQDVQSWRNSHELNVMTDSKSVTEAWDKNLFAKAWTRSITVAQCSR